MLNSVNCSTVIRSPIVKYLCSWEKPVVKPMAPGSIFIILIFQHLVISFAFILLCIFKQKYQKYYPIISIRSHSRKWPWRDWQSLYRVGCEVLVCLCRYEGFECSLQLDWYLGSQKLREILTLLCCITLSSSRENQRSAQKVAFNHPSTGYCSSTRPPSIVHPALHGVIVGVKTGGSRVGGPELCI